MKSILRTSLISMGLAIVTFLIINSTFQASIVKDVSMQPTLIDGQRLIINKALYDFTNPKRGDIIIVHPPIDSQREFVKRLIGLPRDTIEIKYHVVYVNNIPLVEPYIKTSPDYNFGPFTIPENNYFILGDNRNNSTDSHLNWTVTREEIVGKAWLRIWPPDKWGSPGNYPLNDQLITHRSASTVRVTSPR
jgi:signal peptidase I